jgi:hypothetical protein
VYPKIAGIAANMISHLKTGRILSIIVGFPKVKSLAICLEIIWIFICYGEILSRASFKAISKNSTVRDTGW